MTHAIGVAAGFKAIVEGLTDNRVVVGPLQAEDESSVGLVPYPLEDDSETGEILSGLQVRIKGTKAGGTTPVLRLQEEIWEALCMPEEHAFPDVTVVMIWRQSSAPIGSDAQGRPEIMDNYYLRSDRLGRSG